MICVLPYGSDRPTSRFPAVTYALIAVNALVFLWKVLDPNFPDMGLYPSNPTATTLLTSMFIHQNFLHLAWNMIFLYMFGPNVEEALGSTRYAVFFFASGLAAGLLHVAVAQHFTPSAVDVPMVGASGAIAGILGVYAIRFYKTHLHVWFFIFSLTIPAWVGLGVWFTQQLIGGVRGLIDPSEGGIAYWSHIGGMIFGMLLAYVLRLGREGTKEFLMTGARISLEGGATWGAAECLHSLLRSDPKNPDVHRELGLTYAMQGNAEQALSHFRKSIDIFMKNQQMEQATESFGQMNHFYPTARLNLKTEFRLARFLVDACILEPALLLLEGIIRSHPGSPEAEIALVKMGDIHMHSYGDPQSAVLWCERFLSEYPDSYYRPMVEKSLAAARKKILEDG